jgi:hypothetical protein
MDSKLTGVGFPCRGSARYILDIALLLKKEKIISNHKIN